MIYRIPADSSRNRSRFLRVIEPSSSLGLDDGYSFWPRAGWSRTRNRLRVLSLTTDPEGAEVLVPRALGASGSESRQSFELVQVLGADLPLTETIEQVLPQSPGGPISGLLDQPEVNAMMGA